MEQKSLYWGMNEQPLAWAGVQTEVGL
jgi:hypothetical protein